MDDLIGRSVVAVERLAWHFPGSPVDTRSGPVHMHFDGGVGVFLSGASDWSLEIVPTVRGDESWLIPFQYEHEGGMWRIRDAFGEAPFAALRGAKLQAYAPVIDEVDQQPVGLEMNFDLGTITLAMREGEIAT